MAAGSTYTPIATVTAAGGSNSQVVMSSIPSTYTDLVLVAQITGSLASNMFLRFNNTSGSGYSDTWINGNGTSVSTDRDSSSSWILLDGGSYPTASETTIYNISIQSYANTSVYKTLLSRANNAARGTAAVVGLWQSTSAINRIDILAGNPSGTIASGSTFTLYGIAAA
jgi:hypothetical protein